MRYVCSILINTFNLEILRTYYFKAYFYILDIIL